MTAGNRVLGGLPPDAGRRRPDTGPLRRRRSDAGVGRPPPYGGQRGDRGTQTRRETVWTGRGPCLQALRSGKEITGGDMLDETRWGDYPAYAASCGIRSSLSLPVAARTDTAGALNLYADPPDAFADSDLAALRALAAQVTEGIALSQRISDAQEFADQMQTAMRSRSVIDQALGIIMGQRHCTADEAFNILRSASQHRNV
nr:GAF and ANTAR domain-containing protein [Streptomyces sp. alain-838]